MRARRWGGGGAKARRAREIRDARKTDRVAEGVIRFGGVRPQAEDMHHGPFGIKGVSRQQVEDALAVCAAFNITNRLADAFRFELLTPEGFEAGAGYLRHRGD